MGQRIFTCVAKKKDQKKFKIIVQKKKKIIIIIIINIISYKGVKGLKDPFKKSFR